MNRGNLLSLILAIALVVSTYQLVKLNHKVEEQSGEALSTKEAVLATIHSRKSVRVYTGEPVSKEDLLTIMKAGMAAPSGIDKRPWKFIAVTNKEILKTLKQESATAAIVVCGDMDKVDERAPEFWITDTSVATQNMLLAIEAMGLGGVWKSVYPWKDYMTHVTTTLELSDNLTPLCIIALGHPTGVEKPKDKYDPSNIRWEE